MLKYILFFIISLSIIDASVCGTNDINFDSKPDTLCVDVNSSICIIHICLSNKNCIKSTKIIKDTFFYGRNEGYIDIETLKDNFLLTLGNMTFNIKDIKGIPVISEIITYANERNIVKFNGEEGTFVQRKKTITNEPFQSFNIDNYSPTIYPNNIENAYKRLTTALKKVKNKTLTEIDLYNISFENGVHDKTVIKINDLAYYYSQYNVKSDILIEIYRSIIQKYPKRTVAYYNLGDAYWALGEKEKARKAYTTYIEQMCDKGLQKKIPKVVMKRIESK